MKQVTMESVKERIARIESGASATKITGIGLSLQHEFELACLRELVAVTEQVRQLTEQRDAVVAESMELKSKGRELLNEACKVYEAFNASVDPVSGDFMDGQTLHEFQFVLDTGSNSTSAILDSLRAEGVEMFASAVQGGSAISDRVIDLATDFARQLRESKGATS